MRDIVYDFLTANFNPDEYGSVRKIVLINSFFIIGMIAFFSFAIFNFTLTNKYYVSLIDGIAFFVFLYSYIDLRRNKNIYKASVRGTALLIIFMLTFAYLNHNANFGLIWTIMVPIFTISLFGSRVGTIISFTFYILLFALLLHGVFHWSDPTWNFISFFRLFFASTVLLFIIYMTEYSFERISTRLKELNNTDVLTQIHNRRKIDEILHNYIYDFQRYGTQLCIAVLDIDNFKQINDTHGHDVGDTVLKEFANILKKSSRKTDSVGRFGGEEFIFILHNTNLENALRTMNNLREKINSHQFSVISELTCSIGVCEASHKRDSVEKLFKCADTALYKSKANGKDQVSSI